MKDSTLVIVAVLGIGAYLVYKYIADSPIGKTVGEVTSAATSPVVQSPLTGQTISLGEGLVPITMVPKVITEVKTALETTKTTPIETMATVINPLAGVAIAVSKALSKPKTTAPIPITYKLGSTQLPEISKKYPAKIRSLYYSRKL